MGFADDMKSKFNYLRSLKPSQQERYNKVKNLYEVQLRKLKIDPNKKNLSAKEQKIINEKIRRKIINQRVRTNIYASIATISLIIIVYFIIKYLY